MKAVFFGTPSFAAHVLDFLLQQQIDIVAVVSKPDRPKGRSGAPVATPVKLVSQTFNPSLPIYQPELVSASDFTDVLKSYQADLFVVVAYGEIIKQHLLDMPRVACINLHASLLPKYRGAAPIQRAIMEGETQSGVTIMHMVKKMDAGDMIAKIEVPITPDMTYGELEGHLCEVGKQALLKVIREFESEMPLRMPQDLSLVTFAPKIELEDCEIHWEQSAQNLHNLVRGVNPHPGAWCYVTIRGEKKRLKINRTKIAAYQGSKKPGTLLNPTQSKANLQISTGSQALELLEIQLEGKKIMSSEELTRGIPRQHLFF